MDTLAMKRLMALAGRVRDGVAGCGEIVEKINTEGVYTREQQVQVAKLKVALEKFVGEMQSVVHFTQDTSPELDEKIAEFTSLQEQGENIVVEIEMGLSPAIQPGKSNEGSHSNTTSKLPKLELPHFDGDILKWSQFWDLFKSNIDSRNDLKDVDKLSYLLSFLSGDAKKTVGGLLMTNKNYQIAIQQLNDQYGKTDKIIEAHYKAINKIKPAKNEVLDCRRAFLEIEQHLRILESMNENVNQNNLLRMTVMEKYPQEIKYELQKAVETDGYSMEVIRKSVKKIISAKENSVNMDVTLQSPDENSINFTTETLHSSAASTRKSNKFSGNTKKDKRNKRKQVSTQLFTNQRKQEPSTKKLKRECIFCSGNHFNDQCRKYSTIDERKGQLKGKCYLCFQRHQAKFCTAEARRCFHCKAVGAHNVSLCPEKFKSSSTSQSSSVLVSDSNHGTILQTAMTNIAVENETNYRSARTIFDTGSQKSYITTSFAKKLKLIPMEESELTVYTFGSMKPKIVSTKLVTLKMKIFDDEFLEVLAYIVPRITGNIPAHFGIKSEISRKFCDVKMADDAHEDCPADVLIGNDYYYSFFPGGVRKIGENLFLIKTVLGWIVSGQPDDPPPGEILSFLTYVQGDRKRGSNWFTVPDPPLNDDYVKDLWDLEAIGIKDSPKVLEQDEVIDFFNQTTKFEDNRYQVKWPWVEYPTDLPHNYGLALGRLIGLLKRHNMPTLQKYDEVLKDQLSKGVIEEINETSMPTNHPVHYLPHHCVQQETRTTKLRIVYDASAKVAGKCSLNEYLYKGPHMLEDLVSLLIRFRQGAVGITADIEKAFLQIGLQKEDRDVTRFLWVKDVTKAVDEKNLVHLRFCRVPFGVISSPFLLAATIQFHLNKKNSPTAHTIAESLYVDNLILSTNTDEQARVVHSEARGAFEQLSMNIREWMSNSKNFMESIPSPQRSDKTTLSVLGLMWNTERDCLVLSFDRTLGSRVVATKRDALSVIASIYDPCGFVAPYTLPARLMLQELWKDKYKWDDELPDDKLKEWENCARFIRAAANFEIPRMYGNPLLKTNASCFHELHCFSDASADAYSAVVYLRTSHGKATSVGFVMSRSRLTPLRQRDQMTTPKLELLGVLIGTRLLVYVQRVLDLTDVKLYLWTDNQAVLGWLKSDRLLPPFVRRRVAEIRTAGNVTFRYVTSDLNPADVATRILKTDCLPELWTKGPSFLAMPTEAWPLFDPEKVVVFDEGSDTKSVSVEHQLISMPAVVSPETAGLDADLAAVRQVQSQYFPREVAGKSTELSKSLRLFVDTDGVLRCEGRLMNADLPFDQKFPILLPKGAEFTFNVIRRVHEHNYHVGGQHTLALVRKKFWVPQGRGEVAKVIRKCENCIKYGGGPFKLPDMPALPKERVASCPPFTYTGLDYLGPLTVRHNGETQKRWCCLFTCMAVRAIHLELVQDGSTEEFLHCLRRFVASKGLPLVIVSDNAAIFKLTAAVLNSPFCEDNKIQWRFITELAPWQGGFYERLIALVKNCLNRTLNKILLTNTQLQTVLKEIESVLNTRPLTTVGPEIDHILTPADFMSPVTNVELKDPNDFDSGNATATKTTLIENWKKGKSALDEFSQMFRDQYLTNLQERTKFVHKQPRVVVDRSPRVGEAVQIKDDSRSRGHWKVGRIDDLIRSQDGNVRAARVALPSGTSLTRSISHLYPLEMDIENGDQMIEPKVNDPDEKGDKKRSQKTPSPNKTPVNSTTNETLRPTRKAKDLAKEKIRQLTQQLLVRATAANRKLAD